MIPRKFWFIWMLLVIIGLHAIWTDPNGWFFGFLLIFAALLGMILHTWHDAMDEIDKFGQK